MNSQTAKPERTVNYREVCQDCKASPTLQESEHPEVCRDTKAPLTPQESKQTEVSHDSKVPQYTPELKDSVPLSQIINEDMKAIESDDYPKLVADR